MNKARQSKLLQLFLFTLFIVFSLSYFSCNKEQSLAPSEVGDASLFFQTFLFEPKNNPQLSEDIVFDIKENSLVGPLKHYYFKAVPTFITNAQSVSIKGEKQISGISTVDFRNAITYTLTSVTGTTRDYTVNILWNNQLPQVKINTVGSVPVTSKTDYLEAQISIDGASKFEDFTSAVQIRGRGNTTWTFPKKP